ncbi:sigma-70 region 4 domain-containing protein [Streptomyces chrestomyceticus]|uniref:sigma-70 region 4 domain-containing protein n=1 Tax=Streptomyces chrestomyceticus TaxID=68185 RepID=UPI003403A960
MTTEVAAARSDLALRAFRQLHHEHYLHYVQLRTGDDGLALAVAEAAFNDLAALWPRVLRSANCPAFAWCLLGAHTEKTVRVLPDDRQGRSDHLHRLLPADQADAVLLHQGLRLSAAGAAAVMGTSPEAVRASLVRARRAMSHIAAVAVSGLPW